MGSDCVFVFAEDMRFTCADAAAQRHIGYSLAELQTMRPWDIKPALSANQFHRLLLPLRNGTADRLDFCTVHEHRRGERMAVSISLRKLAGKAPHYLAVVREQRGGSTLLRREQLREANRKHHAQPLRPMLRQIARDLELDMGLLQAGMAAEVYRHLAYYAARLGMA